MKTYYESFFSMRLTTNNLNKILFLLHGILSDIVFDKDNFKRNIQLKDFTVEILDKDYKVYLFASRPILYAKIIKDIRELAQENPEHLFELCNRIKDYTMNMQKDIIESIPSQTTKKKATDSPPVKKKRRSKNDVIDGWRKIINKE